MWCEIIIPWADLDIFASLISSLDECSDDIVTYTSEIYLNYVNYKKYK